jgi:hydroxybutyrate-dimer hydrolase
MTTHGWGTRILLGAALAALTLLGGCNDADSGERNRLPGFVSGSVRTTAYDGASDDLLTAGLGKTGLASTAPAFANPSRPTSAELRRLAIWSNYRALVDMSANGGYGRFWGPNVDLNGNDTLGEARSRARNTSRSPTTAAARRTSA